MLNGLDLFSGIGGMSIALQEWVRPIAYCEIDPYCQGILLSKMRKRAIIHAPIWDDIRSLAGKQFFSCSIDMLYGGFPCQDISVAGHGKGLEGERSGLFFEIVRLAKEIKPPFIFLENVSGILSRGGGKVALTFTEMGYDCRWCVISAASIGALHRRERWFLLGYSKHLGSYESENGRSFGKEFISRGSCESESEKAQEIWKSQRTSNTSSDVAYSMSPRLSVGKAVQSQTESIEHENWWSTEPNVGRVADGIPQRTYRIRALGNAVVPQQAKEAFKILMGIA